MITNKTKFYALMNLCAHHRMVEAIFIIEELMNRTTDEGGLNVLAATIDVYYIAMQLKYPEEGDRTSLNLMTYAIRSMRPIEHEEYWLN